MLFKSALLVIYHYFIPIMIARTNLYLFFFLVFETRKALHVLGDLKYGIIKMWEEKF